MDDKKLTLLIVDDNKENRELLCKRLSRDGFKTVGAKDGVDAMNVLKKETIHLTLLDIMMPEVDGITLLSQIRENSLFDNMPVIMLTAIDIINVAQDCLSKGACGYITKPYDMDLVKQKIKQCLNEK